MTNEELLAKYLENSLSETESAEFQKLINTSPEFARDVRELSKIEAFLSTGTISAAIPEDFLASVEHHVTEKIHHDKYHAPGSGNAFNKILSGFWIIPMIFLLGVGGYYLLRNTDEKIQQNQETPAPVLKEEISQTPEVQSIPEQPSAQKETSQSTRENPSIVQNEEAVSQQPTRNPDELQLKAENAQSNSDKIAFEKTREKLNSARAEGKKATEAALLKQMGMIAAKMSNITEARAYLNDAMNLARSLHLTELEAESTGELGLIFKKEGNTEMATGHFKKAIELLKASGQSTERWEKEIRSAQ
jgi:hypothetical protein